MIQLVVEELLIVSGCGEGLIHEIDATSEIEMTE